MLNYYNIDYTTTNISQLTLFNLLYGYQQCIFSYDIYFNHMDIHNVTTINIFNNKMYNSYNLPNNIYIKQIIKSNISFVDYYNYIIVLLSNGMVLFTCANYIYHRNTVILTNVNIKSIYLYNYNLYVITNNNNLQCVNIKPIFDYEDKIIYGLVDNEDLFIIYQNIENQYNNILCKNIHKFILNAFNDVHIIVEKNNNLYNTFMYDDNKQSMILFNNDIFKNFYVKSSFNCIRLTIPLDKNYTILVLNNDHLIFINKNITYIDIINENLLSINLHKPNGKIIDIFAQDFLLYILYSNKELYTYTVNSNNSNIELTERNCIYDPQIVSLYWQTKIIERNNQYNFDKVCVEENIDKKYMVIENIIIKPKYWKSNNHNNFSIDSKNIIYLLYLIMYYYKLKIPMCLFKYMINKYIFI